MVLVQLYDWQEQKFASDSENVAIVLQCAEWIREAQRKDASPLLLSTVDWYGYTLFNHIQAEVISKELRTIHDTYVRLLTYDPGVSPRRPYEISLADLEDDIQKVQSYIDMLLKSDNDMFLLFMGA
jgi:hypothetical protein